MTPIDIANNYDPRRVFLGPYDGRSSEVIPYIRGELTTELWIWSQLHPATHFSTMGHFYYWQSEETYNFAQ